MPDGTTTGDRVDAIQEAWRRERPDIDVSSIAVLTRALVIGRHLQKARDRALRELGTDTPTLDVLATLRRAGEPYRLRTSDIEVASPVTAGAISQRLDRLEARGLVTRERDDADRRVIHVTLTRKGRDLIDGIVAGLMEREDVLLTPLSQREQATLQRLLTRWLRWLEDGYADAATRTAAGAAVDAMPSKPTTAVSPARSTSSRSSRTR
jgi:DNA-binding MarR family transcriptional regulator